MSSLFNALKLTALPQAAPKLLQQETKVAPALLPQVAATATEQAATKAPAARVAALGLAGGTIALAATLTSPARQVVGATCDAVLGQSACDLAASKYAAVTSPVSSFFARIGDIGTVVVGGAIVSICTYAAYNIGGGWTAAGTALGGSLAMIAVVQNSAPA